MKPEGVWMEANKNLYETVVVLHPELSDEEAETTVQDIVGLLENHDAEMLRVDRGGKRRLAYPVQKQRYGYYALIHFRSTPDALPPLERAYRLNERVIRYLTVRFDKEEHLTGFTRLGDDDGRDDERDDRRRGGGRRSEFARERVRVVDTQDDDEPEDITAAVDEDKAEIAP
jgi:small subunit ribosomal protein S6